MAYDKTVWSKGDVVTSAKLNKIENQLEASDIARVTLSMITDDESEEQYLELDIKSSELFALLNAGKTVRAEFFAEQSTEEVSIQESLAFQIVAYRKAVNAKQNTVSYMFICTGWGQNSQNIRFTSDGDDEKPLFEIP